MRTWLRSPIEQVCGCCCERIHRGEIVQILSSPEGHPWRKARCPKCAVGEPPTDLPALDDRRATIEPRRKASAMARIGALAEDWKAKAGDR